MVCFSPVLIFQTLQAYCFLTLVGSIMLISNLEGVKLQGPASSDDPSIYKEMTEATVLTDWVVFATCLSNLGQVKNPKASELESAEPNPPCTNVQIGKQRPKERGRDIIVVIHLMEADPGLEFKSSFSQSHLHQSHASIPLSEAVKSNRFLSRRIKECFHFCQ